MANKRFIVRHGLDNSGDNSVVNTITNVAEPVNNSDAATKYYVDTHTSGGTVTSVTATSPVESTGGTAPVISLGTGANGQLVIGTGTGFTKSTLTAGTGVSIANASGGITISATGSGGDVVGPASSTDNAIVRFDSTTGKLIQNSTATLSDGGIMVVTELDTDSIKSATANSPIVIAPDGTGDVHLNADSVRIGDNNADATIATRGTGDLIITTNEGSGVEGIVRLYDGANGNITLTPNGTGQVQVGSDQVVTLIASQTLTNKSLSGSSNTFTNIPNSATTAASANTASAIVARDASGNFSAGTITATLSGNATNVTGTVAVANGGTGLTSLTAGYIPYGNGTSAFGSSANLFWDSTNSRLGVGTNSPAYKLHTYIASGTSMFKFESGANAGIYGYWSRPNQSYIQALNLDNNGDKDFSLYDATNSQVVDRYYPSSAGYRAFFTNGSERMRIDSSGNVGIGATTSSGLLTLKNNPSASAENVLIGLQQNGVSTGTIGKLSYQQSDDTMRLYNSSTYAGSALILGTNNSERVRIDLSGNVGIGTASPAKKLDISVNVNSGDGVRITNTNTGSSAGASSFYSNGTHTHEIGIVSTNYGGYGALTASNFYLYAGGNNSLSLLADGTGVIKFGTGSGVPERMRLDSSGNLGIGVTPSAWGSFAITQYKGGFIGSQSSSYLYTGQNTYFNGTNFIYSTTAAVTMLEQSFGAFIFYRAASGTAGNTVSFSESMRIDSSGNVGIGTSSPSLPLHVYNSGAALAYFESTNANGPYVIWRSSGTSIGDVGSGKGISGSGNVTDFMIASRSTYPMILGTGSTERMRIDSSGNVGIGRTPSYTLDLAGDARFKRNSGSGWVFQTPSSDMRIVGETSGAHLCFIPSSANVGIDTTSPSEKLNVIGKIKASDVLLGNNGTKGYGAITTTTSTSTPTGGSSGDHYYIY